MHVAVVVGTLLLGSWVLNAPEDEEESQLPEAASPPAAAPAAAPASAKPAMPSMRGSVRLRMDRGQGRTTRGAAGQRDRSAPAEGSQRTAQQGMPPTVPYAPTEAMPPGAHRGNRWRRRRMRRKPCFHPGAGSVCTATAHGAHGAAFRAYGHVAQHAGDGRNLPHAEQQPQRRGGARGREPFAAIGQLPASART